VHARGATALLVGGSGLYFRAVVDDLRFPPTDPQVRGRLEARWWHEPAAAHAHLAAQDPVAAAGIDPANVRRTVRALEVIELTGERFSTFDDAWHRYRSIYPDLDVGYLDPPDEVLRTSIRDRVERMVTAGLLDEARTLRDHPRGVSRTAARGIGYAEAFAVLDGELAADDARRPGHDPDLAVREAAALVVPCRPALPTRDAVRAARALDGDGRRRRVTARAAVRSPGHAGDRDRLAVGAEPWTDVPSWRAPAR
jgi:hypothetical protein